MGKDTLFITVASILSVFDILPATDAQGKPMELRAEPTSGVLWQVPRLPRVTHATHTRCTAVILRMFLVLFGLATQYPNSSFSSRLERRCEPMYLPLCVFCEIVARVLSSHVRLA